MRYLFLILLFASCASVKPTLTTMVICDEKASVDYVIECMKGIDSTDTKQVEYQKKVCYQEAKKLYCKKVSALNIKGKVVPCDSVSERYKKYCE